MKTICISNHKGGVGKTTSAVNIAAGLNKLGKKVLLIDFDPQANLTQSLGIIAGDNDIYRAITLHTELQPVHVFENFDLIPSTLDLSGAEIELSTEIGRELILKETIEPERQKYDFVVIDCPPSLGLLTLNALAAADRIIIPLQSQYLAMQGLVKLLEIIEKLQRKINPQLDLLGILITQYDGRTVLNRNVAAAIEKRFGKTVFETKIRSNVALAEAPAQALDIFRYNPNCNGAEDYLNLSKEILQRIQ